MNFPLTEVGLFRANPNVSVHNSRPLVDPTTPGTPGTDTVTLDGTTFAEVRAINYIGKDGQTVRIPLFIEERPTAKRIPITIGSGASGKELQDAVHDCIKVHEVNPIVAIVKTGDNFAVEHVGAGTLVSIETNASTVALTRVPNAGVASVGAPMTASEEAVEDDSEEDTSEEGGQDQD